MLLDTEAINPLSAQSSKQLSSCHRTTMRRSSLILTVLSLSAWSQPQQQAQLPPVVKVEMPPTPPPNFWRHAFDLAMPGFVGGLSAWIAVWLTSRNNERTNAANRKHDLEKLNREHSFNLKRDVLLRLTMSLVQTHSALMDFESAVGYVGYVQANGEDDLRAAEEDVPKCRSEYWRTRTECQQSTASASLAISDELWKSAQAVSELIDEGYRLVATRQDSSQAVKQVAEGILKFTQDSREELGIVR
jgi:hypothetical protein